MTYLDQISSEIAQHQASPQGRIERAIIDLATAAEVILRASRDPDLYRHVADERGAIMDVQNILNIVIKRPVVSEAAE